MLKLSRFRRDKRGNVAMIYALSIVPLFGFVGFSIDYARMTNSRERLQSSIDAAALAGASLPSTVAPSDVKAKVEQILASTNGDTLLQNVTTTVNADALSVNITSTGFVNSSFTSVLGFSSFRIGTSAIAQRPRTKKADIALVLDNTGSMASIVGNGDNTTKIDSLKAAISGSSSSTTDGLTGLLRTAFVSRPDDVRIALVPFSVGVWLYNISGGMANLITPFPGSGSSVCVTDRPGDFDRDNVTPTTSNAATLLRRKVSNGNWAACPNVINAATDQAFRGVFALTKEMNDIDTRIFKMAPAGNTNATVGLFWGRQAVMPGGLLPGGRPTSDTDLTRYIILLTDGDNTQSYAYSQSGATDNPAPIDDKMLAMCDSIRTNDNVIIYTIGFGAGISTAAMDKLRTCAGSPDRAKLAINSGELNDVFSAIAADVQRTRLTR